MAQTSKQVQEEVVQGCLGSHSKDAVQVEEPQQGSTSEYEESEEEQDSPLTSDAEDTSDIRRKMRGSMVGKNTDFKTFQWVVGQRFGSKSFFKQALAKYTIFQGRNVGLGQVTKSIGKELWLDVLVIVLSTYMLVGIVGEQHLLSSLCRVNIVVVGTWKKTSK